MKAIGKGSVSSLLLAILNVASVFLAVFLVLTTALAVFSWNNWSQMVAVQIGADGSPNIEAGSHVHMSIPVSFSMNPQMVHVAAPALGIENAELRLVQGELRFVPQRNAFLAANFGLVIGALAFGLWMLTQLRGVFRSLRDGQPFAPHNAMRVRRVAWAVIGLEILRSATVYFENTYAKAYFVADELQFDAYPHLNLLAIVGGLIILVISEVFRAGTQLD